MNGSTYVTDSAGRLIRMKDAQGVWHNYNYPAQNATNLINTAFGALGAK